MFNFRCLGHPRKLNTHMHVWQYADHDNYSLLKKFCALNFRGLGQQRNFFNNENFPIYGIYQIVPNFRGAQFSRKQFLWTKDSVSINILYFLISRSLIFEVRCHPRKTRKLCAIQYIPGLDLTKFPVNTV